jgi:hypothetical protein
MKDEEYELVPIDPIKKLRKKVEALEKRKTKDIPIKELGENIEELNEQVLKLVTVNINLQSKITELLIKNTEQIEQVTEMIELLKRASEVEVGEKEVKLDLSPVVTELRTMSAQNEEIKRGLQELSNFMRTLYRRERITQAIEASKPKEPQA